MKDEKNIERLFENFGRLLLIGDEVEEIIYDYVTENTKYIEDCVKTLVPILQELDAFPNVVEKDKDNLFLEAKIWYIITVAWMLRAQRAVKKTNSTLDYFFKKFKGTVDDKLFVQNMLMVIPALYKNEIIKIKIIENVDQEPTKTVSFDEEKLIKTYRDFLF